MLCWGLSYPTPHTPKVLGGPCSFHREPSFCTLPSKATPTPHSPRVSLRMSALHVGGPGTRLLPFQIQKTLFISGAGRSFAGLRVSVHKEKLLPKRIAGLRKNSLGDQHSVGFPHTEKSTEVWPTIPALGCPWAASPLSPSGRTASASVFWCGAAMTSPS